MPFIDSPDLRMLSSGDWQLLASLSYFHRSGLIITVPRGFITDLASIPRIFHSLIPQHGSHSPAAILHDYLYATQEMSRKQADQMFCDVMKDTGVNIVRCYAMYLAVRIGGWIAWHQRRADREANPDLYWKQNGL